ncbi:MAG: NAD-dependent epimerase/dehydratase family protein [Actinomycetes bacterium]
MRAVVTGGAGFIGSTLVDRLLAEGHFVTVIDNLATGRLSNLEGARASGDRFSMVELDVRSSEIAETVAAAAPEVVFHLAAQADVRVSVERPVFDAEVNVIGGLNVIEAARAAGARKVVVASSGGTIYGDPAPEDLPVDEQHSQHPISPYGVAMWVRTRHACRAALPGGCQARPPSPPHGAG